MANAITLKQALVTVSTLGTAYGQGVKSRDDFDVTLAELTRDGAVDVKTFQKGKDDDVTRLWGSFIAAAAKSSGKPEMTEDSFDTLYSQFRSIVHASNVDGLDFANVLRRVTKLRQSVPVKVRHALHQCYANVAVQQKKLFAAMKAGEKPAAVSDKTIITACTKKAKKDRKVGDFINLHVKALAKLLEAGNDLRIGDEDAEAFSKAIDTLKRIGAESETPAIDADRLTKLLALEKAENDRTARAAEANERKLAKQATAGAAKH